MTNDVVDKMRNAIARLDAGELTLLSARMDAPPASNGEIEITFVLRFGVDPAFLRRYAEPKPSRCEICEDEAGHPVIVCDECAAEIL